MPRDQDCIHVEIAPEALRRLMANGQLTASDFRCPRHRDLALVKRWCLELLGERLRC